MRHRIWGGVIIILVIAVVALGSYQLWVKPRLIPMPSPSATPAQTLLPSPSAPANTVVAVPQFVPSGKPGVVPVLYRMFDWGTDFQKEHPEWGPVGSIQFVLWEDINPAPDQYNWEVIDRQLAKEAPLKVTLPDGRQIQKPVVIQVMTHISSYPGWTEAEYYDGTPDWVYEEMEQANPNRPLPRVGNRRVGYVLDGCDKKAVLPRYDSPIWQEAYHDMVRAFGDRYNNHPQVTSIVINTGLDGEVQAVKDLHCSWNQSLDAQAGDVRYAFLQFVFDTMTIYRQAFPDKVIYINHAPAGSGGRKAIAEKAASFNPPIGLKHAGLWVDLDSHQGYGTFVGSWDMVRAYSTTLPIWLESAYGLGGREHRYWSLVAGLHYHPDAIDLHPEYFEQSDPQWLDFTVRHLGVTIDTTPSVWTVLRESEYSLQSWGTGGVSGHVGDWIFWLTRTERTGQSGTAVILRENMPVAKEHVFSRQTRKTQQAKNQLYMDFDIDDRYPYVNKEPLDGGGQAYYRVHVTILNAGTDTFALQYLDAKGALASQVRHKGAELGPVDDWVRVTFTLTDARFSNGLPGGNDFRISCEGDGDEYIHLVEVEGGYGAPPMLTPTPREVSMVRPASVSSQTPAPEGTVQAQPATPTPMPRAVRFDPVADTYLDAWDPGASPYGLDKLTVRQGDIQVPLLKFDLSRIPQDAQIDKAVLSFYVRGRSNTGELGISVHRVLRNWDQQKASWNAATTEDLWLVAGCKDPLRDRSSVAAAQAVLRAEQVWSDVDVTDLIRDWVARRVPNEGLLLAGHGSTSVQYDLSSLESGDSNQRPRLWVLYRPQSLSPPATPSPTFALSPGAGTPTKTPSPVPSATNSVVLQVVPTSVLLRQGDSYSGVEDTYLDAWTENANHGNEGRLEARQGSTKVPLLRFDLDGIPSYVSVKRAVLRLYTVGRTNPASLHFSIVPVTRSWDAQRATWNQATASDAWSMAGARDVGGDRSQRIYASAVVDAERQWETWDITELVQGWVSMPESNHGLLILAEGNASVQYDLASSQWYAPEYRPALELEYISIHPSPTPWEGNTPTMTPMPSLTPTPSLTPFKSQGAYAFQQGIDGYLGCADTFIDQWNPNENHASDLDLVIRQGNVRSTLIRFELGNIPRYSRVEGAVLHVYVHSRSRESDLPIWVLALLTPWEEETVTYQRASAALAWQEVGANRPEGDLHVEAMAQGTLQQVGTWEEFDLTHLVQQWVDRPETNHGVIIRGGGDVSVEYVLASSEWRDDPTLRPLLLVWWSVPLTTPELEPTTTVSAPTVTPTYGSMALLAAPSPTPTSMPYSPPATPERMARTEEVPGPTRLVLQQGLFGYDGVRDTYLDSWLQTANMGQQQTLRVRQNNIRSVLLHYDLTVLPREPQIENASLYLWVEDGSSADTMCWQVYMLRRAWDDETANWIEAEVGVPWAAAGAGAPQQDHMEMLVDAMSFSGKGQWVSTDVTSAMRYWLEHPEENYGLLIRGTGGQSLEYQVASSEWPTRQQRPKLLVNYEPPVTDVMRLRWIRELSVLQWVGVLTAIVAISLLLVAAGIPRKGKTRMRT